MADSRGYPRLTVAWPEDRIAILKAVAAAHNVSASEVLADAFDEHLKKLPPDFRRALDEIAKQSKKSSK